MLSLERISLLRGIDFCFDDKVSALSRAFLFKRVVIAQSSDTSYLRWLTCSGRRLKQVEVIRQKLIWIWSRHMQAAVQRLLLSVLLMLALVSSVPARL